MAVSSGDANNTVPNVLEDVSKTGERSIDEIKDCQTVKDYIHYLLQQGEWEMYTYEWLLNRRSFLYYNTLHGSYFFYQDNNELVLFNEESFYLYICTFENTEFIRHLFFREKEKKKIKLKCYIKTMQGRRLKQEDRFISISDLTKYIDPTDYKTLYFYKRNPICFYAICDGHRGIKACEYCQNNLIKNIILFFYGKRQTEGKTYKIQKEEEKKHVGKRCEETDGDFNISKKRKMKECDVKEEENQITQKKEVLNNGKEENDKKIEKRKEIIEKDQTERTENEMTKELDAMSDEEIAERIKMAFKKTDDDFLKTSKFALHGCTVVALIIFKNKMFVANLGDCRAIGVIKKNNLLIHEVLSYDHKPNNPKEKERIKLNGGDVLCFQNVYRVVAHANKSNKKKSVTNGLTLNEEVYLSVSRAIGDKDFKHKEVLSATPDVICRDICHHTMGEGGTYEENQEQVKKGQEVKTKQEPMEEKEQMEEEERIYEEEETENQEKYTGEKEEGDVNEDGDKERGNDEEEEEEEEKEKEKTNQELFYAPEELKYHFFVMACDGVWDILSNQHVVQIIQNYENDPDKACSEIIKTAYQKGSQDNLTAMLFQFF